MPIWPTGDDVIKNLAIEAFHLFEFVSDGVLQPYHPVTGKPIPSPDYYPKESKLKALEEELTREKSSLEYALSPGPPDKILFPATTPHVGHLHSTPGSPPVFLPKQNPNIVKERIKEKKEQINKLQKEISATGDSWKGYCLPEYTYDAKKIINALQSYKYNPDDVAEAERKYRTATPVAEVFPCEPGTKWEDVKITLTGEDTVRVKTPRGEGVFSYHQLGLADGRIPRGKPTFLWALLKLFAKNHGFISPNTDDYDPKLPDTAKRLNKHLKKLFGIEESIYTSHYKKLKNSYADPENYTAQDLQTTTKSQGVKGYKTKIFFSDQSKVVS